MIMMMMMMMQVSVTWFLLLPCIFCSPAWTRVQQRAACDGDEFACGPTASQSCVSEDYLCDGDDDCGDGSDEDDEMCANRTCPSWQVTCEGPSPSRRCVYQSWICDGRDDCGNNWDEEPETCGVAAAQNCRNAIQQQCVQRTGLGTVSPEMWTSLDLRILCAAVKQAKECAAGLLLSSPGCHFSQLQNHSKIIELQRMIAAANVTVNYLCRDNVEVFNEHKQCLLRRDEDKIVLVEALQQQCRIDASDDSLCLSRGALDCAKRVIQQQCGEEIANQLRTLGTKVMAEIGCETRRRYKTKKEIYSPLKLMGKAFPLLF